MYAWSSIFVACMGKSKHTRKNRPYLSFHGQGRGNETYTEKSSLFETALVHVCMYVWAILVIFPRPAWPNIHTYIETFIYFFDVFLTFLSKNVALAMEIEISGCPKNRSILKCMYNFLGRHGQTYMEF